MDFEGILMKIAALLAFMAAAAAAAPRPAVVDIGAMLTLNSKIGGAAMVAIDAAVADINADPTVLRGSSLRVTAADTNCDDGFLGMVEAMKLMETDTVAIVGPQCSTIAHIISFAADELRVPLVSFATDPTLTALQFPFFVRAVHSDLYMARAIADVVDYFHWRLVSAIYLDDDYGRNAVAALDDELTARRCKISHRAPFSTNASDQQLLDVLVTVGQLESRVVVLHAGGRFGPKLLELATHLDMVTDGYVWIATDWLSVSIDSGAAAGAMDTMQGVLTLRAHTPDTNRRRRFAARWPALAAKYGNTSLHLNAYALYVYDSVWAVARAVDSFLDAGGKISFSNDSRLQQVADGGELHLEALSIFDDGKLYLDHLRHVNFTGVSGEFRFDAGGDMVRPAYDILNVVGSGIRTVGYWSNYSGLTVEPPEQLYGKPANKSGVMRRLQDVIWPGGTAQTPRGWAFPYNARELRVAVPFRHSFTEFVTRDNATGEMKGYCIDVFAQAVAMLNYPVAYKLIPFGSGDQNPNYDELVSKVASNEFDAAVGDIAITMNRTTLVDFTQPFIESGLAILAPVLRQRSSAWAFLQPFTLEMWCVTGLFFIIVGAVVWILEHRINDEFRGPPRKQIVTIFWFSFSTLFFAHRENTVSTLARGVLIIWMFVVLIIQSSYTASLTSILTVQQLTSPVRSVDDLQRSDEPIGFQVGSFAKEYLIRELNISRSRFRALGSPEEYSESLIRGPKNGGVVAIVDERPYIDLFRAKECQIAVAGSDFTSRGWGFAFPRDSQLQVDLSTAILQMSESGDLQRIHDKWLATGECSADNGEVIDSNRLRFDSFWGLFLICGAACLLALSIYLYITMRQFCKHGPPGGDVETPLAGSGQGSVSGRSLRSFMSFVDEKEGDMRTRSAARRQLQQASSANGRQIAVEG